MKPLLLHLITGLTTGGAETTLARLMEAGDRLPVRSVVVCLGQRAALAERIEAAGVEVHALEMRGGPGPVGALRLAGLARQLRPDLIQGWMYQGNLAANFARRVVPGRPPVLWNVRQSLHDLANEKPSIRTAIHFGALWSATPRHIIYNSRAAAEQHRLAGFRSSRAVVVPNGIDCEEFRPREGAGERLRRELGIESGAPLIGMVARYHPVKNHAAFLAAAAILVREGIDAHYVLVGPGVDGSNEELGQGIRDAGLAERFRLLGERADVAGIVAGLDIATCASRGEAFPNAVAEAMACGIPCVITDVGDAAWLLGEAGRVVPPDDPETLARGWLAILALDPASRADVGGKGRRRIEAAFTLEAMVERYAELWSAADGD